MSATRREKHKGATRYAKYCRRRRRMRQILAAKMDGHKLTDMQRMMCSLQWPYAVVELSRESYDKAMQVDLRKVMCENAAKDMETGT